MITLRHSEDRGRANFGWLDSKHTFSFGNYYDAQHMGFSALRVINDDIVQPGAGFDTHGHRDMEIISYVLEGTIDHKDSEGNVQTLPAGEFQLMSAGKGIYHSEYNGSDSENLRFLQIWIQPNTFGQQPGYQQKKIFGHQPGLTTIATPSGENGTLHIKQDATLHQLILEPNQSLELNIATERKLYVHQVKKIRLKLMAYRYNQGTGLKLKPLRKIKFHNPTNAISTSLVFELP
ncbi:pirin family protein [Vibrio sinaloensis]|nr:pirin family protein [Vibrio sinaloensis]